MQRDINKFRDFETGGVNKEEYDIIRKKRRVKEVLVSDPDIKELLEVQSDEELNAQILKYLRLSQAQTDTKNYIMIEVRDVGYGADGYHLKEQYIDICIMVHESNIDTEYDVPRTDLLGFVVKDLLNWSNVLGQQLKCISDEPDIIEKKYFVRNLQFLVQVPNGVRPYGSNKYDRFS